MLSVNSFRESLCNFLDFFFSESSNLLVSRHENNDAQCYVIHCIHGFKDTLHIHQSAKDFIPLTFEVNNIDFLVTLNLLRVGLYYPANQQPVPKVNVLNFLKVNVLN